MARIAVKLKNKGAKLNTNVQTIAINPMIARNYNVDFDGDGMGYTNLQSEQAKRDFHKLFIANNIKLYFDPDSYIPELTHEAVYTLWAVTEKLAEYKASGKIQYNDDPEKSFELEFKNFKSVKIKTSEFEESIFKNVYIESVDQEIPFFWALIHKTIFQWGLGKLESEEILFDIDKVYNKGLIKKMFDKIYNISKSNIDFMNRIWKLNQFLNEISSLLNIAIPTFEGDDFVVGSDEIDNFKKSFVTEPVIGFHQNMFLFKKIVLPYLEKYKNGDNILNKVFKSGSRLKAVQLMKSTSSSGIPTDIYGRAVNKNISTSLLDSLKPDEMFQLANGARMALAARETLIPVSGEMQRIIMNSIGFIMVDQNVDDCGCEHGFKIKIKDEKMLRSLQKRVMVDGHIIDPESDKHLIGQTVEVFSPITCKLDNFRICKKCWGHHLPPKDKKGISYVGTLAASAIVEQLLQSSLRLHHTGGTWEMEKMYDEIFDMIEKGVKFWVEENADGEPIAYTDAGSEDLETLKSIMIPRYYKEDELEILEVAEGKTAIIPHVRLQNQDASRILREFANLVYRKREVGAAKEESELIMPEIFYEKIIDIVFEGAYLLSSYVEVIISALFYDQNMESIRYSSLEPYYQIPLKSVIQTIDPKLSVFYKLSNNALKNIYQDNNKYELDHMMYELMRCYR